MSNLDRWNRVKQPPKSALKPIHAGRLKGKSDINPQWRLQAMTDEYGEIGKGWYYNIEKVWNVPGADNEVMMFVQIHLYTKDENSTSGWSAPVSGQGGSVLIAKEKNGMHNNDEAFKMAVTDAIGVAMKQLGFAADIYLGLFDGSKYANPVVKSAEALPSGIEKTVDEEFPTSQAEGLEKKDLRKAENVAEISKLSGRKIPDVLGAINAIPDGEHRTIGQLVNELKENK